MHKKKFGFIESNTTGTGQLFLNKAIEMGLEIVFLTSDPTKYFFLKEVGVDVIHIDTKDKDVVFDFLKKIDNLVGVFSTSEYYMEVTAYVADNLGLPGNNPLAIEFCRNKNKFSQKISESSFLTPKSLFIDDLKILYEKVNELNFPVILKPVSGSGSVGVKKCVNFQEVQEHALKLLKLDGKENGTSFSTGILVQPYVEGPEYSAEIFVYKDKYFELGLTAKHTSDDEYFIEVGHDFPAPFERDVEENIWNTIKAVLKLLNFSFGPAHIEFKLTGTQVVLIEVNPRLAGGMIPQLITYACQFDIYEHIIKLFANQEVNFPNLKYEGASIRFFVVKDEGKIVNLTNEEVLKKCSNVQEVCFTKNIGDLITINHDYRDRIGYLITKSSNTNESKKSADHAIQHFFIDINNIEGRLGEEPHPLIKKILRSPINKEKWLKELDRIASIDLAHVLMLARNKLIDSAQIDKIILVIQNFKKNLKDHFESLDFSRGTYYAYEKHLKNQLGIGLVGNNHLARSRNDINATLFYLSCRDSYSEIFHKILELSQILLNQAQLSEKIPLPIYSQHQPAAPGNYSFYLLAINAPIQRIVDDLVGIQKYLNTSPLGAGAGCGTDIPISPDYVAEILGFESTFPNALDAIANRDFALRYKSILATLCTTISRIAQDYQLWTTQEFQFFEFPDSLCGSSSMMPQKKNPYILEIIKSKTANVINNLFGTFIKMHKVPIGNSIEVSSAAYDAIEEMTAECLDILDLLILVINHALPIASNMVAASKKGLTIANFIANQLMKQDSISFREAHIKIGDIIRKSYEHNEDPFQNITNILHNEFDYLHDISKHLCYGGGPSSSSIRKQIAISLKNLNIFLSLIKDAEDKWNMAKITFENEIKKTLTTCNFQ
ncbi:lyase family protein [Parachlamydia acanthamoebae]|uniref:lyase family protein n=1 Tax=Parachlamydia acanthamoebae TaxID=83552 RepID=UPI000751264B|nr:lyase family protein [Parachlamydia acanthamoebae]